MRIVRTRYKVLFIAAWLIGFGIVRGLLEQVGAGGFADWLGSFVSLAMTFWAVRVFRVPEEDIPAPRALWRMTGRPTAGFLFGGLIVVGAAFGVWGLIYSNVVAPSPFSTAVAGTDSVPHQVVSLIISVVVGVLYLRSSFRLARRVDVAA